MIFKIFKLPLWIQVLIGLLLGIVAGYFWGEGAASIGFIGDIFINLIMMIIAPLIFFSVLSGVINMESPSDLGRVGGKAFLGYLLTTIVAVLIAYGVANVMSPGHAIKPDALVEIDNVQTIDASQYEKANNAEKPSFLSIILNIFPDNALKALVEKSFLQIIFVAVLLGVVLVMLSERTQVTHRFIHEVADVFYKTIELIIKIAPIAVFALIAKTVGTLGFDVLIALGSLVLTTTVGFLLQYLVLIIALMIVARVNPLHFIQRALTFQIMAFSTSSSSATIPTTLRVARSRLGVSESSASMIIPLGATVNMNGGAISLATCTLFAAQMYGIELSVMDYALTALTIVLVSVGSAGIPGGTFYLLPVLFNQLDIPLAAWALIYAVDRFIDMQRTVINVTGDAAVSMMVDASEGKLDRKVYNEPNKFD